MKVRMRHNWGQHQAGRTADVPDGTARTLFNRGLAAPLTDEERTRIAALEKAREARKTKKRPEEKAPAGPAEDKMMRRAETK